MLKVLTATGGIAHTNCFLIADESSKEAVLFDAPDHTVAPLLAEIDDNGWKFKGLWLTHGHFDHLADHAIVTTRFPAAELLIHDLDAHKLRQPGSRMFQLPFTIPPGEPTRTLADGETLQLGNSTVMVIHTPGHSPGHVCFHFQAENLLIGGDLIIGGAIGRTDFPDCSPTDMEASLQRIMTLPDDTRLLGGHGPATTLGHERASNPYVRLALQGRLAERL